MEIAEILDLATGAAWLALAVVFVRMRGDNHGAGTWLLLGTAFCALRAFDYIAVSYGNVDAGLVVRVLDVLVLATLLGLVLGAQRLSTGLARKYEQAEHAQTEYGRALLDYTQLVRHRIANPLTAVKGGIQTLLDLDLDRATRQRMLQSMLASATQLERVALHPEQLSEEEQSLQPMPAPLESKQAKEALVEQAGEVESDFRDVNRELIDVLADDHVRSVTFVCECSARDCTSPITMTLDEYFRVHEDGAQFVVTPNHNLPAVEDVLRQEPGWWIVKKRGKPAREARRRA